MRASLIAVVALVGGRVMKPLRSRLRREPAAFVTVLRAAPGPHRLKVLNLWRECGERGLFSR
jgi:hypothetical protein